MRYFVIGIIILILPLIFGCVNTTPQVPQNSTQINNTQTDYTWYSSPLYMVYYPRNWYIEEPQNGAIILSSPSDNKTNIVNQFVVEIWDGNESSPQEFEDYEKSLMQNYTILNKKSIQFKGKDAFVIEMEGSDDGKAVFVYKTIFFRNGEWVYRLGYAIDKNKVSEYKPVMEDIIERFQVGSG